MSKRKNGEGADRSTAPEYRLFSAAESGAAIAYILKYTRTVKRGGRGSNDVYNDLICTADTETSKTGPAKYRNTQKRKKNGEVVKIREYVPQENIVVAWTFSARNADGNICTVYGAKPTDFVAFIVKLQDSLPGDKTVVYWHNMSYDWVFIQRFLFKAIGTPSEQLNTKAHYPVRIEFENGLVFKDSLIVAQKSLERWADELDVEHKKAVGFWDYDRLRDQRGEFTPEELEYIEHDTLALAECLEKLRVTLHKHVYSIPLTCTAIIREETLKEGRKNRAKNRFIRMAPSFELYNDHLLPGYHGGYTHNNRHAAGWIQPDPDAALRGWLPTCYDFASSYPFRLLVDLYPCERFHKITDVISKNEILDNSEHTAFIFTLCGTGVRLRDPDEPMPVLQLSKTLKNLNAITDNGRILSAEYVEIILTEVDLKLVDKQYIFEKQACFNVYTAAKGPLPRWFRDLVYKCFEDKTMLKGGDPVDYALAKAKLNSLYGMCCQKSVRPVIEEDYDSGEFTEKALDMKELYDKYLEGHNNILPYFWGVWCTAYAMSALFDLGACLDPEGVWLYSDTDSVYALGWDMQKLNEYNAIQQTRLLAAGYGPVRHNGREYWPGVAELDGVYQEFVGLHSKCYAVRKTDGSLKITVAGVPKTGAACLKSLEDFKDGFVFPGEKTGKLTHYYMYRDDVFIDENGIEHGNSIDLAPCDYEIGLPKMQDLINIAQEEEVDMIIYDEKVQL